MNLDDGNLYRGNRVAQCHRGVRETAGIKNHTVRPCARILKRVNQRAFVIRLPAFYFRSQRFSQLDQLRIDLIQCHGAIDIRFTRSKQISNLGRVIQEFSSVLQHTFQIGHIHQFDSSNFRRQRKTNRAA